MTRTPIPALLLAALLVACPAGGGGGGSLSVNALPDRVDVVQGSTADLGVTVTRAGTAGPVTLNVTGLPSGVTATTATIPDGSNTGTVTLSAGTAVPQGPLEATVTASAGSATKSAPLHLFVRGPAGSLDTTWNATGIVLKQLGANSSAVNASLAEPDGTLVVGGYADGDTLGQDDALVARFTPSGALDASFGAGGKARLAFSGVSSHVNALAFQPDGKILAAGVVLSTPNQAFLARLNASGTPDAGFASGSVDSPLPGVLVIPTPASQANAVALAPDGTIVLAGSSGASPRKTWVVTSQPDGLKGAQANFDLAPAHDDNTLNAVVYDPANHDFIAAGWMGALGAGNSYDFAALRFKPTTGAPAVPSPSPWGAATYQTFDFGDFDEARAATLDAQDRLLVAGTSYKASVARIQFGVWRLKPDGTPDASFGTGGGVQVGYAGDEGTGIAVTGGNIVVTGRGQYSSGSDNDFYLVRLTPAGALDPAFGTGGRVYTDLDGAHGDDDARSLSVLPDGRLVVSGVSSGSGGQAAIARYWN
ncbi:MAG TPA: hypothetical protein VHN99_01020 [Deinococcales bacterium]|nr:hypothetical protein [Deinococcales bacterium]